jgi:hypothetical protein
MNLRLFIIIALLESSCASYAMDKKIQMPSADALKKRLDDVDMANLYKQTDIVTQLADQQKSPKNVRDILETSLAVFMEKAAPHLGTGLYIVQSIELGRHGKHIILKALLQDAPEGLEELQEAGLYMPQEPAQ